MVLGFLGVVPQRLRELVFFWLGLMKNGGSCRSTERKWPKDNKLETFSEVCVFRFVLASLGNTPSRDLRWAERAEGQGDPPVSGVLNFIWLEMITVARYRILEYCVLSLNSLPVHFFMGLLVWVPTTDLSIDMLMNISITPRFWRKGYLCVDFYMGASFDHIQVNAKEMGCRVMGGEDAYCLRSNQTAFQSGILPAVREISWVPIPCGAILEILPIPAGVWHCPAAAETCLPTSPAVWVSS